MSPQARVSVLQVQSAGPFDDEAYRAASDIVQRGYSGVCAAFRSAKDRGVVPRGRVLVEMMTSGDWTSPPLLSNERLGEFCKFTNQYLPEDILATIWFILEHTCEEQRLIPALKIDRTSGLMVVTMTL